MEAAQQKNESVMDYAPDWTQISVLFFVVMGGGVLASLSALALAGTVVLMLILTPVFLLLSPVILPVGAVIALAAAAFMAAVTIGIAGAAALIWVYRYARGQPTVGSEKIDRARVRLFEAAEKLKAQLQYKLFNENSKANFD
uniref:Oleosin L n=1 Tax=Pinus massoniana TaxID=88730 RepID=OLEL_PINMS|nr:RecName: Full=Oleosin L [Pinus massoniana]AIC74542.1 oleosin-L [Pinus massoniana]